MGTFGRYDSGHFVGTTARRVGGSQIGPLEHAATSRPASRTGKNVRAVCGASIRDVDLTRLFDPSWGRACRRCVKELATRGGARG